MRLRLRAEEKRRMRHVTHALRQVLGHLEILLRRLKGNVTFIAVSLLVPLVALGALAIPPRIAQGVAAPLWSAIASPRGHLPTNEIFQAHADPSAALSPGDDNSTDPGVNETAAPRAVGGVEGASGGLGGAGSEREAPGGGDVVPAGEDDELTVQPPSSGNETHSDGDTGAGGGPSDAADDGESGEGDAPGDRSGAEDRADRGNGEGNQNDRDRARDGGAPGADQDANGGEHGDPRGGNGPGDGPGPGNETGHGHAGRSGNGANDPPGNGGQHGNGNSHGNANGGGNGNGHGNDGNAGKGHDGAAGTAQGTSNGKANGHANDNGDGNSKESGNGRRNTPGNDQGNDGDDSGVDGRGGQHAKGGRRPRRVLLPEGPGQ